MVGYSKSPSTTDRARQVGVIDVEAPSALLAVAGADIVLVAVPVAATEATLKAIKHLVTPQMLIMDVGSTKADVVQAARHALRDQVGSFVPAHPITGREVAGVEHADAELYYGRQVILTPTERTLTAQLLQAQEVWQAIGCRVSSMSPESHDSAFAAVSHLPHLLAFAMMNTLTGQPEGDDYLSLAGPGFPGLHPHRGWRSRRCGATLCWPTVMSCWRNPSSSSKRWRSWNKPSPVVTPRHWKTCSTLASETRRALAHGCTTHIQATINVHYRFPLISPRWMRLRGEVLLPGSKSISNRVLLLSALSLGTTTVYDLLASDDTRVMLDGLRQIGCEVEESRQHGAHYRAGRSAARVALQPVPGQCRHRHAPTDRCAGAAGWRV